MTVCVCVDGITLRAGGWSLKISLLEPVTDKLGQTSYFFLQERNCEGLEYSVFNSCVFSSLYGCLTTYRVQLMKCLFNKKIDKNSIKQFKSCELR